MNPRLPVAEKLLVPERKLVGYLLNEAHPDGRGKARFFSPHGFTAAEWQTLAEALRRHAAEHPVVETAETPFGFRSVVEGILHAADGRKPLVRSVWFVVRDGDAATLVTAYPLEGRSKR